MMGGGSFGNRTAVAEFNIWADPEAAAVVFGYGGPLVMAGLDVTHQFCATPERIEQVAAVGRADGGNRLAALLADLFDVLLDDVPPAQRRHRRGRRPRPAAPCSR